MRKTPPFQKKIRLKRAMSGVGGVLTVNFIPIIYNYVGMRQFFREWMFLKTLRILAGIVV